MRHNFINIECINVAHPAGNELDLQQSNNPYWAKVWYSAYALVAYITENNHFFLNKRVIELGAGLGLPSLFVAQYATSVHATDIEPDAVVCVEASIAKNVLTNVTAQTLDWFGFINYTNFDIVLLSDVNYEPDTFIQLTQTIKTMLEQNLEIFIATPQRLLAKAFVDGILPYVVNSSEYKFGVGSGLSYISVFHLHKKVVSCSDAAK